MHAYLYPGVVLDPSALASNYSSLKLVCICGMMYVLEGSFEIAFLAVLVIVPSFPRLQ